MTRVLTAVLLALLAGAMVVVPVSAETGLVAYKAKWNGQSAPSGQFCEFGIAG